jgi:hypothetical protein
VEDVVVGILALVIGGLFCFRGYLAMRLIIPVWGAFAGFALGAGLVAYFTDEGFLSTLVGWLVGLAVGVVFALIAYLYYAISVLIAMASIGFTLGASAMVALDVTWSWVVILVGVLLGALLAFLAIVADLPTALLVVLSAVAGAIAMTAGVMLIVGALETDDFTAAAATERIKDDWWWYAVMIALAVARSARSSRCGPRCGRRGSSRAGRPAGPERPGRAPGQYSPCTLTVTPILSRPSMRRSVPSPSHSISMSWCSTRSRAQPLLCGLVGTFIAPWMAWPRSK